MPDSRDTGEKPQRVNAEPIKLIVDGNGVVVDWDERALDEGQIERLETFLPLQVIRERLLSREAIGALARERFDYLSGYGGTRWEEAHESIRRQEEDKARLFIEAALDAAFSKEEGS